MQVALTIKEKCNGMKNGFKWKNFTVYPMTVENYDVNITALSCLTIMQQSMPIQFLGIPYLRMLHQSATELPDIYGANLHRLQAVFCNSLHIEPKQTCYKVKEDGSICWLFSFRKSKEPGKNNKFEPIDLTIVKNAPDDLLPDLEIYTINETDFVTFRELVCEINAQEIPDESLNLDIWESEKDIREQNALPMEYNFEKLLFSISNASHRSLEELLHMTIWEFVGLVQAIERDKHYTICALTENVGHCKYPDGNPCPDWKYDRAKDTLMGMMSYGALSRKLEGVSVMSENGTSI